MWFSSVADSIKKAFVKFILKQYLGHILIIDSEALSMNSGSITLERVPLNVKALQPLLSGIEIQQGIISNLALTISWSSGQCSLKFGTIEIECKQSNLELKETASSLSSTHLADQFIESLGTEQEAQISDIQQLAQVIESLLGAFSASIERVSIKLAEIELQAEQVLIENVNSSNKMLKRTSVGAFCARLNGDLIAECGSLEEKAAFFDVDISVFRNSAVNDDFGTESIYYSAIQESPLPLNEEIRVHCGPIKIGLNKHQIATLTNLKSQPTSVSNHSKSTIPILLVFKRIKLELQANCGHLSAVLDELKVAPGPEIYLRAESLQVFDSFGTSVLVQSRLKPAIEAWVDNEFKIFIGSAHLSLGDSASLLQEFALVETSESDQDFRIQVSVDELSVSLKQLSVTVEKLSLDLNKSCHSVDFQLINIYYSDSKLCTLSKLIEPILVEFVNPTSELHENLRERLADTCSIRIHSRITNIELYSTHSEQLIELLKGEASFFKSTGQSSKRTLVLLGIDQIVLDETTRIDHIELCSCFDTNFNQTFIDFGHLTISKLLKIDEIHVEIVDLKASVKAKQVIYSQSTYSSSSTAFKKSIQIPKFNLELDIEKTILQYPIAEYEKSAMRCLNFKTLISSTGLLVQGTSTFERIEFLIPKRIGVLDGLSLGFKANTLDLSDFLIEITNKSCFFDLEKSVFDSLMNEILNLPIQNKKSKQENTTLLDLESLNEALQTVTHNIAESVDLQMEPVDFQMEPVVTALNELNLVEDYFKQAPAEDFKGLMISKFDIVIKLIDSIDSFVEFNLFNLDGKIAKSYTEVSVTNFEISDCIRESKWNKFLTFSKFNSKRPREKESKMLNLVLDSTRELRVKLSILPLTLYIDQDTLEFLVSFFTLKNTQTSNSTEKEFIRKLNLTLEFFEMDPWRIEVDYKPKHLSIEKLKQGRLVELLNVVPLEQFIVNFPPLKLSGINGWDRLVENIVEIYLSHIKSSQIGSFASSISGLRSIVSISNGIIEAVKSPIDQYRTDGNIVRGLGKGAAVLAKTTAIESLKVGTRVVSKGQSVIESISPSSGAFRPVIGATEIISKTLTDLTATLSPEDKEKMQDKYRSK